MSIGYVHSIETFGSVDGPGVRFVIFLKGCNMRCRYCHNPDTWKRDGAEEYSAEELIEKALRYKVYWGDEGGITVSGGEPMLQAEFVTELFTLAKENGINTALDTAGEPYDAEDEKIKKLLEVTDLVILDLKEMVEEEHIKLTGKTNKNILEFARHLSEIDKPMWIRHVLVPGLTDEENSLLLMKEFISKLKNVKKFELLPYHSFGVHKWETLGIPYSLEKAKPPTVEEIERAKKVLEI